MQAVVPQFETSSRAIEGAREGAYVAVDHDNPHVARSKAMLDAHPELKGLCKPASSTFVVIVLLVAGHVLVGWLLRAAAWWKVVAVAYGVGAFFNVSLYSMIHECGHQLVFKTRMQNRFAGFVANLPLGFPSAESFARYHNLHHVRLGEYETDVSIPRRWEARFAGSSAWRKAIWISMYSILYPLRVYGVSVRGGMFQPWMLANLAVQVAFNGMIVALFGWKVVAYFLLSFLLSFGLHPLNAMTLQEHSFVQRGQDTYSYYGLGNWLTFNAGYHHEHHDLPAIPWSRIRRVKAIAPEFYADQKHYDSWTALIVAFVGKREWSLWRRPVRLAQRARPVDDAS
jgi:sphingolipid delta-4 desaturase